MHTNGTPHYQKRKCQVNNYVGITYPRFLGWRVWTKYICRWWKRFLCSRNIHLFDEVWSHAHYLNCDACDLMVHIALIETREEGSSRIHRGKYLHTTITEVKYGDLSIKKNRE